MDCNENWEKIGNYVDDALERTSASEFDAHVASCARCRAVVMDLRALRGAARELEPHAPPADAWVRLARAIEAEERSPAPRSWLMAGLVSWQPLAATAMFALVASGLSWIGGHLSFEQPVGRVASDFGAQGTSGNTQEVALDGSVDSDLRLAEEQYMTAIASLEAITRGETARLDDQTVDVFRSSVEIIDEAIGESRSALEQEPTNELAQESLFDALRSKVALLQEAVALMNEVSQDAADGSTSNGPGLNQ